MQFQFLFAGGLMALNMLSNRNALDMSMFGLGGGNQQQGQAASAQGAAGSAAAASGQGASTTNNQSMYILAVTCDFQQCGILTCVDSDEPVQPPFKVKNSKCCSVSSLTLVEYSSN